MLPIYCDSTSCFIKRKSTFLFPFQSLSAARPVITVYAENGKKSPTGTTCALPAVYKAPIRPDIVSTIHHEIAKNHRQPYAVNVDAGECCGCAKLLFSASECPRHLIKFIILAESKSRPD